MTLHGEDMAAYDELCSRFSAAIKPADVVDEMYLNDVTSLEWEVLRWRRLKLKLFQKLRLRAIGSFLATHIDYHLYGEKFAEALEKILRINLETGQTIEDAKKLAWDCAKNSPEAVDAVNNILDSVNMELDNILDEARAEKAGELLEDYRRQKPSAVKFVNKLLAEAAMNTEDLIFEELDSELESLERIDRLTTIAETRRDVSLREIDRRRTTFGEVLRRNVQQIEQDELKMITTAPVEG